MEAAELVERSGRAGTTGADAAGVFVEVSGLSARATDPRPAQNAKARIHPQHCPARAAVMRMPSRFRMTPIDFAIYQFTVPGHE